MNHRWTLVMILCTAASGCRASTEQCDAAFESSMDIAVAAFVAENPNATEELLAEVRGAVAQKRRDNFMETCSKTTPAVADCMAAAKTIEAQRECAK